MPKQPLDPQLLNEVKEVWAAARKQNAIEVWKIIERRHGNKTISKRKVQQIISEIKRRGGSQFTPQFWTPWRNPEESPEDARWLFSFQQVWQQFLHRGLYVHEATWVQRLGPALAVGKPDIRYRMLIVSLYAEREMLGLTLNESISTNELDGIMTYHPWTSRNAWQAYTNAIAHGFIRPSNTLVSLSADNLVADTDALLLMLIGTKIIPTFFADRDQLKSELGDYLRYLGEALLAGRLWRLPEDDRNRLLDIVLSDDPKYDSLLTDDITITITGTLEPITLTGTFKPVTEAHHERHDQ